MANTDMKSQRTGKSAVETLNKAANAATGATKAAMQDTASAAKDMADAAFDYPKFEVPEMVRSFSEQGVNQTREAYGRMKAATEEATGVMEESMGTARETVREVQFKTLDLAKANADATFDFFRQLLAVNSVADAFQLQTSFARERFEAFVDYSKDVQPTLTRVGAEATKPAKVLFDRALSQAKAA